MSDESSLAQLLLQDGGQALKNGLVNGAKAFGNQAAWTAGGMNGPQPSFYAGGSTPNQYVDQHWGAMADQGRPPSADMIMQLIQAGRIR